MDRKMYRQTDGQTALSISVSKLFMSWKAK